LLCSLCYVRCMVSQKGCKCITAPTPRNQR